MVLWLDTNQLDLASAIAQLANLKIVGAGSPVRGQSGACAARLDCRACDDLRSVLATAEAEAVLFFSPPDQGTDAAGQDVAAFEAAAARGLRLASLEPIPATIFGDGPAPADHAVAPARSAVDFIPRHRAIKPLRDAAEVLVQFGPARTLSVEAWSVPGAGSLGAALFSSMDLVLSLMGEPRLIDAVYLSAGGGIRAPQTLRDLHGDLTAVLRFDDARAATLVVSDQGGRWNRTATLTSPAGRFRVFDDGFEWIGSDGKKLDEMRQPLARRGEASGPGHAQRAIAQAVLDLFEPTPPDLAVLRPEPVLVLCETVLLSVRTSQAESPESIRRMLAGTTLG